MGNWMFVDWEVSEQLSVLGSENKQTNCPWIGLLDRSSWDTLMSQRTENRQQFDVESLSDWGCEFRYELYLFLLDFKIQRLYCHMLSSYSVEMAMKFFWPELLQQCNIYNKILKYKVMQKVYIHVNRIWYVQEQSMKLNTVYCGDNYLYNLTCQDFVFVLVVLKQSYAAITGV